MGWLLLLQRQLRRPSCGLGPWLEGRGSMDPAGGCGWYGVGVDRFDQSSACGGVAAGGVHGGERCVAGCNP